MDAKECIKTRRSVRKFNDKPITKETIEEVVSLSSFAPSWKNSQTVKYYALNDKNKLQKIAEKCFGGFQHNKNILSGASGLVVLTTIDGIAGFNEDGSYTTSKGTHWQSFDAGIACQTFCLAAHTLGLGSVIMGIYDEAAVKEELNIPEGESVSALITLGYYDSVNGAPKRKELNEILKFI